MPSLARIVGHHRAISGLRRALQSRRLGHALLFSGPAGVGKSTTARALAAAVNCDTHPGEGCDTCSHCRRIADDSHPDFIIIAPDGAFIKIDQVRQLEQHTAVAPYEAPMRVIVIDQADTLHPSAANALLKSVEEPRPDTLFVLTTAASHRVIPTLISRCQRLRFSPLTNEQVRQVIDSVDSAKHSVDSAKHSVDSAKHDAAALAWAAEVAEGSPGRAIGLLSDETWEAARSMAQQLEQAAAAPRMREVFDAVNEMGRDRTQMGRALELLQIKLRTDLLASAKIPLRATSNPQVSNTAGNTSAPHTHRSVIRRIDALQQAQQAMRANANAAMTLETLVLALREEAYP